MSLNHHKRMVHVIIFAGRHIGKNLFPPLQEYFVLIFTILVLNFAEGNHITLFEGVLTEKVLMREQGKQSEGYFMQELNIFLPYPSTVLAQLPNLLVNLNI